MPQPKSGPGECPLCKGQSRDRLLCSVCVSQVRDDLTHLPGLMRDLSISRTGRAVIRSSGAAVVVRDPEESPVPFNTTATKRAGQIVATVGEWLQHFSIPEQYRRDLVPCDCTPPRACPPRIVRVTFVPGRTIAGWCAWLVDQLPRIRLHPDAVAFAQALDRSVKLARATVDLPPDQVFVRECPVCSHGIFAPTDADVAVCRRCKQAGVQPLTEWPVSEAREVMTSSVDEQLATAGTCALVLAEGGLPVRVDTIHNWARSDRGGRLIARGENRKGDRLYRVGDVRALAQDAIARAEARTNRKASVGT